MNQFEKQLSDRINNNVPEHQDRFWEDLEQQMSTHVPVEVTEEGAESVAPTVDSHQDHSNVRSLASHRGTSNVGMNNAEMSDIEVGNIEVGNAAVRPASSQSGGKYGRSLAFLASAACVVVALGFAASTIRPTTSETAFAGSTATEYRPIGLKTELDDATKPAPVELSDDKKERLSIDPARIDGFDSGALVAPSAVSGDEQWALYRIDESVIVVGIDGTPDLDSVVILETEKLSDDLRQVKTQTASFSPKGPVVAMRHPAGAVIWNYETGSVTFYTVCPGFACSYNTQGRIGSDVWFDGDGALRFDVVDSTDDTTTPVALQFGEAIEDDAESGYNSEENEIPGVFDEE